MRIFVFVMLMELLYQVQAFFKRGPKADGPDGRRVCWSNVQVNLLFKNGTIGHLTGSYDAGGSYGLETLEVVGSEGRFVLLDACEHLTYYPRFSRQTETYDYLGGMMGFNETFGSRIGTWVEQNIAGATPEEIERAARQAQAYDFIRNMPQGFDSPIGERGQLLSGGQKARIAIARAFVRNAPILILDEPTAALDSRAEAEIQSSIDSLEQGRTVICIAHRLSTLANMDEIVVLDHGRIVERGTFEELLRAKGHFAKMAEQQRLTA